MKKEDLVGILRAIDSYCQQTPVADRNKWPAAWSLNLVKTRENISEFLKDLVEASKPIDEITQFNFECSAVGEKWIDKDEGGKPIFKVENGLRYPSITGDNKVGYDADMKVVQEKYPEVSTRIAEHNAKMRDLMAVEVPAAMVSALVKRTPIGKLDSVTMNPDVARMLEPLIEV